MEEDVSEEGDCKVLVLFRSVKKLDREAQRFIGRMPITRRDNVRCYFRHAKRLCCECNLLPVHE